MKPLSKILVGTDYSEQAKLAVAEAAELSQALGAELHLVYAWAAPYGLSDLHELGPGGEKKPLLQLILDKARDDMETFVADIPALKNVTHQTHVLSGEAAATLASVAEKDGCDLIVVGSHGRHGISRAFLGSVAERTVQLAHCPVLVVPGKAKTKSG